MRKRNVPTDKMCYKFLILSALTVVSLAEECVKVDTCTCRTSKATYSLKPLSRQDGPRFDALHGSDHYYYNPCKNFTKQGSSGSTPVVAVIIQYQGNVYYPLADDKTATFSGDPELGTLKLTYTHTDSPTQLRKSVISIKCLSGVNNFQFIQEEPKLTYSFTLTTDLWCRENGSSGLSVGSILVILFFVFLVVYLVAGVLFLKYVRRADGLELVPNYEFWKALPPLIRDGCYFTFRGCKTDATYEKI